MAYLNKQQVRDIIQKAPANLDKAKLVESLAKTNTLEGYNDSQNQKSVGGFATNVIKSGVGLVSGTAQALTHPIETVSSLGKVAAGGVSKLIPGQQGVEQNFDNTVDFFKQRYGGVQNIKDTLYNDPVGVAADVATLASGVGAVSKLSTASKLADLSKVTDVANTVSRFADPLQAVTSVPSKLLPKASVSKVAESIYQSALKPSTTLSDIERAKIISTGLKEGIPINSTGVSKLGSEINSINKAIGDVIEQGRQAGDVVKTDSIVKYLDDVKQRVGNTINGKSRLDEITKIEENFIGKYGEEIPTDVAQQIKKNTYQVLRKSYGEMKNAAIEAEKAMARGIKEQLVKKYPQLENLNARDSALINLDKSLERAVARINNKDVVGLGTTVASTANVFAGLFKAIIDNPTVKSQIAIALQKISEGTPRKILIRRPITPAVRLTQPSRE